MLVHRPGDRSHHRPTDGTMNAVCAGLLYGMFLTGDQAVQLGDQLLQIESEDPSDFPVIVGGISAVGNHNGHPFLGAEHGFALELPTGEVLGVIGGLATVVDFESHVFPPEIMIVA